MIRNSTSPRRGIKRLFNAFAIAAAMCAAPASQAGVLDFETPLDSPFVYAEDGPIALGQYYIQGGGTGWVGGVITNDACFGVQCPVNNPSNYFAALNDGYLFMGMLDGSAFSIASLDASFIGGGMPSYPAVAGLLYLTAFNAAGAIVDELYLDLAGPLGGNFNFATYDLTGFGGGLFSEVRIASYACPVGTNNCDRTTNQAQFALDNIVTVNAVGDVPEPGTFALMGLGLLGLRAFSRRRTA